MVDGQQGLFDQAQSDDQGRDQRCDQGRFECSFRFVFHTVGTYRKPLYVMPSTPD